MNKRKFFVMAFALTAALVPHLLHAKTFTPKDIHIMGIWGSGGRIAVRYQFRVEFFQLPNDITFADSHGNAVFTRKDGSRVNLETMKLKPKRILSFRHHIDIRPTARAEAKRLMMCTNMVLGYTPVTDAERAYLPRDEQYFPWVNAEGKIDDFCGVVSFDGEVIWKLDYRQQAPEKRLQAVDLLPDGSRGLIYVGSGESAEYVGNPRELIIWEYPDKVKKKPAARNGPGMNELFLKFREGAL